MTNESFKEFEHKYVLDPNTDVDVLFEKLRTLPGGKEKSLEVSDHYYYDPSNPDFVYRHRKDREIQQLTVKSYGGDARDRLEINLELLNDRSQGKAIESFFKTIGNYQKRIIEKSIRVIDFPDCECVYYKATNGIETVYCFEFEALGVENLADAIRIMDRYEKITGFDPATRCHDSLFDLLKS